MDSGVLGRDPGEHIRRLQQMAQPAECRELEILAAMEHRTTRNYFRLLEAERRLHARVPQARRGSGAMLAQAIETERQRIGRELHTAVGQALAGIRVHVSLIREAITTPPEPLSRGLDRIELLSDAALEQVRNVSRRLYTPTWQMHSLSEALRILWESSGIPEKFDATLTLNWHSPEPPPDVRRAVYLAAQEGISNIIQHANATRVRMILAEHHGGVMLTLEDNGSGFAPPSASAAPAGIGLRALSDLADELGGEFETTSGPGGARLTISFPVIHE